MSTPGARVVREGGARGILDGTGHAAVFNADGECPACCDPNQCVTVFDATDAFDCCSYYHGCGLTEGAWIPEEYVVTTQCVDITDTVALDAFLSSVSGGLLDSTTPTDEWVLIETEPAYPKDFSLFYITIGPNCGTGNICNVVTNPCEICGATAQSNVVAQWPGSGGGVFLYFEDYNAETCTWEWTFFGKDDTAIYTLTRDNFGLYSHTLTVTGLNPGVYTGVGNTGCRESTGALTIDETILGDPDATVFKTGVTPQEILYPPAVPDALWSAYSEDLSITKCDQGGPSLWECCDPPYGEWTASSAVGSFTLALYEWTDGGSSDVAVARYDLVNPEIPDCGGLVEVYFGKVIDGGVCKWIGTFENAEVYCDPPAPPLTPVDSITGPGGVVIDTFPSSIFFECTEDGIYPEGA